MSPSVPFASGPNLAPASSTEEADASIASELMGRHCAGDVTAFPDLYSLLSGRILGYLRRLVGDSGGAEDMLQETFLKVHASRSRYIAGASPIPWIYVIAHRTGLDQIRRRRRRNTTMALYGAATTTAEEHGETVPETSPATTKVTMAALQDLPSAQRQALILTKLQGLSQAEAAHVTGTSVGAIKLRVHRGYVALRQMVGPQPEEIGGRRTDRQIAARR